MVQTAAHMVDHVIPHVPVRQWVLSLPIPLRLLLAAQAELVTPVLQVLQRVSWAKLLMRVFEIDMEHCPNCGGELKLTAATLEQPVIEKILNHVGLQAQAPPRAPARGQAPQAA
jgi:hypothetical protein